MSELCPVCDRPVATERDEAVLAEHQGADLCWKAWDVRQCEASKVDWRARYVAERARAERLEAMIQKEDAVDREAEAARRKKYAEDARKMAEWEDAHGLTLSAQSSHRAAADFDAQAERALRGVELRDEGERRALALDAGEVLRTSAAAIDRIRLPEKADG